MKKGGFPGTILLLYIPSLYLVTHWSIKILKKGTSFSYLPATLSLAFFIISLFFIKRRASLSHLLLVYGFFLSLSLAWVFKYANFSLGGGVWDSWIYHSMVEKFRHFWGNRDFAYKGLHSFYPFYFHYFLGKIAWILGLPSYKIIKYFPIILALFLPLLIFLSYRGFFNEVTAAGIAIFSLFFLWRIYLYKPFEFLSLVFLLPWWLYYVIEKRGNPLWGGVIGGLLFSTFYYWFFPVFLLLFYEFSRTIILRPKEFWEKEKKLLMLAPTFLLISFPFWGGYLWDVLRYGGEFYQQKWFKPWHLNFIIPLKLPLRAFGVLAFLGLLYMLLYREEIASALFKLLMASYIFYLMGNLGIVFGLPLLQFKVNDFVSLIFIISFFMWAGKFNGKEGIKNSFLILLAILATLSVYKPAALEKDLLFKVAQRKQVIEVKEEYRELYGKTVLALPGRFTDFVPCYIFANYNPRYSHPSARRSERLAFLYLLRYSKNPDFFSYMLRHNPFAEVDFVYFKARRIHATYSIPDYPYIYTMKPKKFVYPFSRKELLGGVIFENVLEKGDAIVSLKKMDRSPQRLLPLERFILAIFGGEKMIFKHKYVFKQIKVYSLGKYLVFFRKNCRPNEVPSFKILLYRGQVQEIEYSLRKDGILGRICAGVFKIPKGATVVKVEAQRRR